MTMTDPILIASTDALIALCAELAGEERLAVDTEFHAERRYWPELMTVQLATEAGRAWVIDALACGLEPLGAVLSRRTILLHGGTQDILLLSRACGQTPPRILDTQRLAALAGSSYPARLGALVSTWLDGSTQSSSALTDWSKRPLTPDQLRYAAEDAQLLFPLLSAIEPALRSSGRWPWAVAASEELRTEASRPPRALDAWRGWDIAPALSAEERGVLTALMEWRDHQGQERDQPPHYLIGDSMALALARRRPQSLAELGADRRVAAGLRKRYGAALLDCIERGLAGPAPPPVPTQTPARTALLRAWAVAQESHTGVSAGLALPTDVLHRVAELGPSALTGWRREALGEGLMALWQGTAAVGLAAGAPTIVAGGDSLPVEQEPTGR